MAPSFPLTFINFQQLSYSTDRTDWHIESLEELACFTKAGAKKQVQSWPKGSASSGEIRHDSREIFQQSHTRVVLSDVFRSQSGLLRPPIRYFTTIRHALSYQGLPLPG